MQASTPRVFRPTPTTQIYTHVLDAQMQQLVEDHHPLSSLTKKIA